MTQITTKSIQHYVTVILVFLGVSINAQNRSLLSLNEDWQFVLADSELELIEFRTESWENVHVPHTWNDKDIQSGEKVHYGTGWYKKEIQMSEIQANRRYFIKFEGVGQHAKLYLNSSYVGEHLGSYSAFVFDITTFLKEGKNELLLRVNNELNASYPKDNFLFGIYGGVYRDVWLIETSDVFIGLTDHASNGVFVRQPEVNSNQARLEITTQVTNTTSKQQNIQIIHKLLDHIGNIKAENTNSYRPLPGGLIPFEIDLRIKNPRLWNGKKNPYLYTLQTKVLVDGKQIDQIEQSIGIRSFSIDPKSGFILNGEPYKLYGVCRHQEWQDLGNALLPEHHARDMELIKEVGATSIRLAHYQQADNIYTLADQMGILVWAEIPFVNGYLDGADENAKLQMTELIKQNFNHPSIFVWGVHNEVIKGKTIYEPVKLTTELHNLCKTLDPDRYTVSVSNIWWVYDHPIHELCDLQGFNQYTGWYGGNPEGLGRWINNYHNKKPDIRISVSEYGAGGNIFQQSLNDTTVPNPTGQFFPEGYQTRYHETTWTAIEKYPFIWASYVWNMFDFSVPEWNRGGIKGRNHKGLITYDRRTKKDAFYWYKANWSEEPVLHIVGKRNDSISTDSYQLKAYCNKGVPEVSVNGGAFQKMVQGINKVQYLKQINNLKPGENKIVLRHLMQNMEAFSKEFTIFRIE